MRSSSLKNADVALDREIDSTYDDIRVVAKHGATLDIIAANINTIETLPALIASANNSEVATGTDVLLTHADVVLTHADVESTAANAAIAQTAVDIYTDVAAVEIAANVSTVNAANTSADAAQTALDKIATNADNIATSANVATTNADAATTNINAGLTNADAANTLAYWNSIDTQVTVPLIAMATDLINLQAIVAEHHAFA